MSANEDISRGSSDNHGTEIPANLFESFLMDDSQEIFHLSLTNVKHFKNLHFSDSKFQHQVGLEF